MGKSSRPDRYEEARRHQSSRRELPGQAGYGRGRDFSPREFYARDRENIERRFSEPFGRARFEEDYYGGEASLALRDYNERGREPRIDRNADWEDFGNRSINPYQGGGYRAADRDYGASRNPRFAADADRRDDYARGDQGARPRWIGPSWAGGGCRDEYARYHGIPMSTLRRSK